MIIKNKRGQGMVEYIVLVALVAVAAIGITELMGQTVRAKLAQITLSLQGKSANTVKSNMPTVEERFYSRKGLDTFSDNQNNKKQ